MSAVVGRLRDANAEWVLASAHDPSTRELLEGLAAADAAVIVVDAAKSPLARTLRDVALASLAGVGHIVLAVGALEDTPGAEASFKALSEAARRAAEGVDVAAIPVFAGQGIVEPVAFPWYAGPTLRDALGAVPSSDARLSEKPFRMAVRSEVRDGGAPGVTGTIASGSVRPGDRVRVLGQTGGVARVVRDELDVDVATAGETVTLVLEGAIPTSPGELVSTAERPAEVADQFEATVVWLDETPLLRGRNYVFELSGARRMATIGSLKRRVAASSTPRSAAQKFEKDELGVCNLRLDRPVAFDPHHENRRTGGFRLIDPTTGSVVGAGALHFALRRAKNVHWQAIDVNKAARSAAKGQRPCVLWYTGLSGAGKSTIANLVDKKLHAMGRHTYLLDGDNVRHGLNKDLGFTAADRVENIRRIAEVAKLMVDAGLIVGTAFISPFRAERSMARALLPDGEFIEIHVDTPLGVAEERDPKGLYKKARRGELKNFTGIDSPYEAPENPELRIDTTSVTPETAADLVVAFLGERGVVDAE
ncbi:MAG TPA: adenylyl-sulfate kinase [Polyangiaceae bacterium]